ncbi:MAG: F0F1 ATP synthase subunit A [Planctomycetes bacterium]|nr:F0F1 ATP synthase subunit A [Planctomycetota bacterium]
MILAAEGGGHGVFHHVYDFFEFELPFGLHLQLPYFGGDSPETATFALTKFMVLQVLAALFVLFIYRGLANRIRSGDTSKHWWWNFWEMLAVYIRDEVVRPIIGDPDAHGHDEVSDVPFQHVTGHEDEAHHHPPGRISGHPADRYLPFVWSCFFYVLICNLIGAVPFFGSATGNINVTAALAVTAFGATFLYGAERLGPVGFWKALVPTIDAPGPLKIFLIPMMFVIEVVGLFIKHAVLAVRLFANIMGGHTVLGVILGFIAMTAHAGFVWWLVTPASIFGQIGVGLLELLVAFIQAYVFAFLSTIFIGMALHPH